VPDWLHPISVDTPCGPSLEYDAEYAVLLSRMLPRGDAQYGDFVGTPEAPNWAEIERDCRRLLLRTWDINLLSGSAGPARGLPRPRGLRNRWSRWPKPCRPGPTPFIRKWSSKASAIRPFVPMPWRRWPTRTGSWATCATSWWQRMPPGT
jgi:hypothetical protein